MKKKFLKALVALAVCAACAWCMHLAWFALTDQTHIDETFYQVESDKLVSNVRAVFLSDLHLSEFGEDNCELVDRVRALKPDLILIGGDMNRRQVDDYGVVISLCLQLKEIAPTYYALGNHEVSRMLDRERDIYYAIEATGVTLVHNVYAEATVGENKLIIGGVSQSGGDIAKYSGGIIEKLAAQEGFKLLMSHYPSNYEYIYPYEIDLVLSGHLHGGQVNLPYLDGLYSNETGFFPDYTEGKFEEEGTVMIVSRGLGNSSELPRVNNDPELVIVDMSGSTAAYNTLRLLSKFDDGEREVGDAAVAADEAESSGTMLRLMREREAENDAIGKAALN